MSEPLPRDPRVEPAMPRREPVFNIPAIVVILIAANVLIHLLRMYVLSPDQDLALLLRSAFIPERYSGGYLLDVFAFTTPVTYSVLHGNLAHLAINMVWLAAFGSPLATRIGVPRFLAFWIFTAAAAAGLHYLMHATDPAPLVGASGAISGMMGAAARFGFRTDRSAGVSRFGGPLLTIPQALSSRIVLVFLAVWFVVNLIAGLGLLGPDDANPIAWEAHVGGFLAGFLAIRLFDRSQRLGRSL